MLVEFTIPGKVAGKGRARATLITPKDRSKRPFISEYTPVETRREELRVRNYATAAMCGRKALDEPVWVSVLVQLVPPPSWSKRKREEARYVTGKPDPDNALKLIFDACNGVCWTDDSRIAAISFARFYELDGPEEVTVRFGILDATRMPVPEWAPKTLPLFEGAAG